MQIKELFNKEKEEPGGETVSPEITVEPQFVVVGEPKTTSFYAVLYEKDCLATIEVSGTNKNPGPHFFTFSFSFRHDGEYKIIDVKKDNDTSWSLDKDPSFFPYLNACVVNIIKTKILH